MDYNIQQKNMDCRALEQKKKLIDLLEKKEMIQKEGLSFKIIDPSEIPSTWELDLDMFPRVLQDDPIIKERTLKVGTVVAFLRDYELTVKPYYFYRIVCKL